MEKIDKCVSELIDVDRRGKDAKKAFEILRTNKFSSTLKIESGDGQCVIFRDLSFVETFMDQLRDMIVEQEEKIR